MLNSWARSLFTVRDGPRLESWEAMLAPIFTAIEGGALDLGLTGPLGGLLVTGLEGALPGAAIGAAESALGGGKNLGKDVIGGALTGAVSPILGGVLADAGVGPVAGRTLGGAATGALGSALTGGNALQGALTGGGQGLISSLASRAPTSIGNRTTGGGYSTAATAAPAGVQSSTPDITSVAYGYDPGSFGQSGSQVLGVEAPGDPLPSDVPSGGGSPAPITSGGGGTPSFGLPGGSTAIGGGTPAPSGGTPAPVGGFGIPGGSTASGFGTPAPSGGTPSGVGGGTPSSSGIVTTPVTDTGGFGIPGGSTAIGDTTGYSVFGDTGGISDTFGASSGGSDVSGGVGTQGVSDTGALSSTPVTDVGTSPDTSAILSAGPSADQIAAADQSLTDQLNQLYQSEQAQPPTDQFPTLDTSPYLSDRPPPMYGPYVPDAGGDLPSVYQTSDVTPSTDQVQSSEPVVPGSVPLEPVTDPSTLGTPPVIGPPFAGGSEFTDPALADLQVGPLPDYNAGVGPFGQPGIPFELGPIGPATAALSSDAVASIPSQGEIGVPPGTGAAFVPGPDGSVLNLTPDLIPPAGSLPGEQAGIVTDLREAPTTTVAYGGLPGQGIITPPADAGAFLVPGPSGATLALDPTAGLIPPAGTFQGEQAGTAADASALREAPTTVTQFGGLPGQGTVYQPPDSGAVQTGDGTLPLVDQGPLIPPTGQPGDTVSGDQFTQYAPERITTFEGQGDPTVPLTIPGMGTQVVTDSPDYLPYIRVGADGMSVPYAIPGAGEVQAGGGGGAQFVPGDQGYYIGPVDPAYQGHPGFAQPTGPATEVAATPGQVPGVPGPGGDTSFDDPGLLPDYRAGVGPNANPAVAYVPPNGVGPAQVALGNGAITTPQSFAQMTSPTSLADQSVPLQGGIPPGVTAPQVAAIPQVTEAGPNAGTTPAAIAAAQSSLIAQLTGQSPVIDASSFPGPTAPGPATAALGGGDNFAAAASGFPAPGQVVGSPPQNLPAQVAAGYNLGPAFNLPSGGETVAVAGPNGKLIPVTLPRRPPRDMYIVYQGTTPVLVDANGQPVTADQLNQLQQAA